jgi:hypothetical protein
MNRKREKEKTKKDTTDLKSDGIFTIIAFLGFVHHPVLYLTHNVYLKTEPEFSLRNLAL